MNNFNPNQAETTLSEECTETGGETRKNSRLALYLAFLALFFTALGITVGYKHWLRIHDKAKQALVEISQIKEQLSRTADSSKVDQLQASLSQSSSDAEVRLTDAIHELDRIREQTTYSAKTVTDQIRELTLKQSYATKSYATNGIAINQNLKAEIRFLLETAKHRLFLNHDKTGSLQLLKAADQLLIQAASSHLISVREKLAKDIAQLEQFSMPNTEELLQVVSQLETDIKPLSTPSKEYSSANLNNQGNQPNKTELFDIKDKDSLTGKVKTYLNHSISISKQTDPPQYSLNKSDKQRTDQLLMLRLESLRLMLLQRQDKSYHQQIDSIKNMFELYYSASISKPWLTTLRKLNKENLTPAYPNISNALEALVNVSSIPQKDN